MTDEHAIGSAHPLAPDSPRECRTPAVVGLHTILAEEASREGFPISGGVDIEAALADPERRFARHVARYDEWIERGAAGEMSYLIRGRDRRADPRVILPSAKSVFCVAIPYPRRAAGAPDASEGPRYARYLQGPDYHEDILARLTRAMERVLQRWRQLAASSSAAPRDLEWKICVDHSAVLERAWAYLAGLGWIGKNTMLIHPKLGSYLFLGEVLISEELGQGPAPMKDYCGHCERCLKGCPTSAIKPGREIDSRDCISYHTLERRGPMFPDDSASRSFGTWIAGCDVCQEVCPFNFKPARDEAITALSVPPTGHDRDATRARTWIELLSEDEAGYRSRIRGSALARVKFPDFRRNLAWSLRNVLRTLNAESLGALDPRILPLLEAQLKLEAPPHVGDAWLECIRIIENARP